jgi:general secretion pathway protein F
LREQNLVPLTVEASRRQDDEAGGRSAPFTRTRLSGEQLALLTRLLGTLLASGLPLDDALSALARQSDSRASQRIVLGIRSRILEGRPLADGMALFPQVFPEVYRATVGAGEQTRHLPLVLKRLADFVEARDRIAKRVRLAMVYPAVLSVVALAALGFLITYVVPEVVKVFDNVQHELPLLTRWLIATSGFARHYGLVVAGAVLLAILGVRAWLQRPGPRYALHALLARLPLVGRLLVENDMARFSRMLAIMLGSSVDMLDGLHIASKSVGLLPLRAHVEATVESVREGAALSRALGASPLTPPLLVHLCASGEAGGNLIEMLDTAAEAFEYRVQNSLALVLSLLEPLLILLMGAMVLAIVIAILLPIFEMNRLV